MIISHTPFPISFFGGETDYPVWFKEHGGAVLANTNAVIEHPAVRGVLQHLNITQGLEIHHDGDLPARTGMRSSSSLTVGCLYSLCALQPIIPSKSDLAQMAINIEPDLLRKNTDCRGVS